MSKVAHVRIGSIAEARCSISAVERDGPQRTCSFSLRFDASRTDYQSRNGNANWLSQLP